MTNSSDTICALATANGIGAIALIRVSGKETLKIVSSCFSKDLIGKESRTAHFGYFRNASSEVIDEVLITVFEQGEHFYGDSKVLCPHEICIRNILSFKFVFYQCIHAFIIWYL